MPIGKEDWGYLGAETENTDILAETRKVEIAKKPRRKKITKSELIDELIEIRKKVQKLLEVIGIKVSKDGAEMLKQIKEGKISLSEVAKELSNPQFQKEMLLQDTLFNEVLKADNKAKSIVQKAIQERQKALAEGKPDHVANKIFWGIIEDYRKEQEQKLYKKLGINYVI